ncbi:MAG: hypothetical protein ABSG33_11120 [Candidatus Bathyarchaeia archaeon]
MIPEKIGEMPVFPLDKHVSLSLIFALNQKSNMKNAPSWNSLPWERVYYLHQKTITNMGQLVSRFLKVTLSRIKNATCSNVSLPVTLKV